MKDVRQALPQSVDERAKDQSTEMNFRKVFKLSLTFRKYYNRGHTKTFEFDPETKRQSIE